MKNAMEIGVRASSNWKTAEPLQMSGSAEFRHILVPVDLTDDSRVTVDYAVRFAKAFGSTLHLLHFYQEPYILNNNPRSGICDAFKQQRQKVIADFYNLLHQTQYQHPNTVGYFEYGNPDHEIARIGRELRADLIILSMHNGRWLEHLLFGRHADRIVANAPCPVLVVREPTTGFVGLGPEILQREKETAQ